MKVVYSCLGSSMLRLSLVIDAVYHQGSAAFDLLQRRKRLMKKEGKM
jgi:hypothetical protein